MAFSADAVTATLAEHIEHIKSPANATAEQREATLQSLTLLYDFLDDMTVSLEDVEDAHQREKLREIVSRYAVQVRCSIDIIVALFSDVAFQGRPLTQDIQEATEKAFRTVFVAIHEFVEQVASTVVTSGEINPNAASIIEVMAVGRDLKRKGIRSKPR